MPPEVEASEPAADATLGRLRLGAEPLADQVARYRRATWGLTAVVGLIGLMFLGLFGAFGRPGLGAALGLVVLGPIVGAAWLEVRALGRRAAAYEATRAPGPAD